MIGIVDEDCEVRADGYSVEPLRAPKAKLRWVYDGTVTALQTLSAKPQELCAASCVPASMAMWREG